jgi:hypothetical protein
MFIVIRQLANANKTTRVSQGYGSSRNAPSRTRVHIIHDPIHTGSIRVWGEIDEKPHKGRLAQRLEHPVYNGKPPKCPTEAQQWDAPLEKMRDRLSHEWSEQVRGARSQFVSARLMRTSPLPRDSGNIASLVFPTSAIKSHLPVNHVCHIATLAQELHDLLA